MHSCIVQNTLQLLANIMKVSVETSFQRRREYIVKIKAYHLHSEILNFPILITRKCRPDLEPRVIVHLATRTNLERIAMAK